LPAWLGSGFFREYVNCRHLLYIPIIPVRLLAEKKPVKGNVEKGFVKFLYGKEIRFILVGNFVVFYKVRGLQSALKRVQ